MQSRTDITGSGSIDDGGGECDDVDRAPTFTAQDERRELATLSVDEIVSLQTDLRGITYGFANLSTGDSNRPSQQATKVNPAVSLPRLNHILAELPAAETAAYRRAVTECPSLVSDERKLPFLERENDDIAQAAKRLARYWEVRLNLFGPDRCFLPMRLDGAMRDEARNLASRRIFQVLPVKDTAGRAILYGVPSRRNFREYTMEQEIMAVWYLLETCIEDPEVRGRGVVFVADGRNMQRKHYSRRLKGLAWLMKSVMPVRIRGFHFCYPSRVAYYVLRPALISLLGREFRLRFKMHFGSQDKVLRDLEGYCLPKDRLPIELGGTVVLDMDMWMKARRDLEGLKSSAIFDRSVITEEASSSSAGAAGPSSKRLRISENGMVSTRSTPSPSASQIEPAKETAKGKGKPKGRKPDPRMTKAAEAKMKDPTLSLRDALILGGFVFNANNFDEDNISLRQRTNNLCRRIRQENDRLKKEKENERKRTRQSNEEPISGTDGRNQRFFTTSSSAEAIPCGSDTEKGETTKPAAMKEKEATEAPAKAAAHPPELPAAIGKERLPLHTNDTPPAQSSSCSDPSQGTDDGERSRCSSRRDSFLEQIMSLPGIDGLDSFHLMDEDDMLEC